MCRALRPVPVSRGPAALTAARRTDAGPLRQQKALRLQGFPFYCFRFVQGAGVPVGLAYRPLLVACMMIMGA